MKFGMALLALTCAAPVAAQQAFSRSMIECSIIYSEVSVIGTAAVPQTQRTTLAQWSQDFAAAALVQAAQEGQPAPDAYVAEQRLDLQGKWAGRFSSVVLFEENKDWLDYCRSFGRSQGILQN